MGALDTTMDRTYKVLKEVINDTIRIFPSKYIHLGADEFVISCQKNRSGIINLQQFTKRVTKIVK